MGLRGGGGQIDPTPQHILVFKYPSRDRVNGLEILLDLCSPEPNDFPDASCC